MKSQNADYLPACDHLRAVAAILVIVFHGMQNYVVSVAQQPGFPAVAAAHPLAALVLEGHTALGLFFVLSGFIFTHIALGREVAYGPFLRNRLLRIAPMLVVVATLAFATQPAPRSFEAFFRTLLPVTGVVVDLGPFATVCWSVGVEFLFYLLFPFLLAQLNRQGVNYLIGLVGLLVALRLLVFALTGQVGELHATPIGRLDQFMIGMMAAVAHHRLGGARRWWAGGLVLGVAGLLGACWAFNLAGGWNVNNGWKVTWPTIEAALWAVIAVSYIKVARGRVTAWLTPLAWLGTISYSLYLLHVPIMQALTRHHLGVPFSGGILVDGVLNSLALYLPLTAVLATATYHLIERPFLRSRARYLKPLGEAERGEPVTVPG
jgi:peptidoglycan/LPS O-acetylase OafA/YrhL